MYSELVAIYVSRTENITKWRKCYFVDLFQGRKLYMVNKQTNKNNFFNSSDNGRRKSECSQRHSPITINSWQVALQEDSIWSDSEASCAERVQTWSQNWIVQDDRKGLTSVTTVSSYLPLHSTVPLLQLSVEQRHHVIILPSLPACPSPATSLSSWETRGL